jgi:arylformamidase
VKIIDLTHPLSNDMPMLDGMARPRFEDIALMERDGYRMSEYQLLNHSGTHVDAPSHLAADGDTLDEIPLTRLVCDAVTIDVSAREPGLLPLAELEPQLEQVRPGDLVFLHSGNGVRYGTDAYWTGWSYPDAGASRALVDRGISGIGFDGPSADPVDTQDYGLHRIWLEAGRLILENLSNLDQLPPRAPVVVAPLKVRRANGAPARVLALLPDEAR